MATMEATTLHEEVEEDEKNETDGYTSTALKGPQRLVSAYDKHLPELPPFTNQTLDTAAAVPSVSFSPLTSPGPSSTGESFPFNAKPGSVGPPPTTDGLSHSNDNGESSPVGANGRRAIAHAVSTPPRRRSVQFARGAADEEMTTTPLQRITTAEELEEGLDEPAKDRQATFFGKLKALASPVSYHNRSASSVTGFATPTAALSPQSERSETTYPLEPSEMVDSDAEEDSEEQGASSPVRSRKRRKAKRPTTNGTESAPTTPKTSRFASFIRDHQITGSSSARPSGLTRQSTLSDMSETERDAHTGVSEDEGRDRVRNAWRRGIEGARGLSYGNRKQQVDGENNETTKRPGNLRRFTGFGALDGSNSPFRLRADRQGTTSTQKWKQVKAGLKMLGQKKRDERMRVDHQKSAQLMAELLAGGPAALILASMYQRDEHGHRKVPVLLEQLKIRISHSEVRKDSTGDRHQVFDIELEYGNGPARMRWKIRRSLQDFVKLHAKYKAQGTAEKFRHLREDKTKPKMPRFPKSAFPYGRGARGLFASIDDEEEEMDGPDVLVGTDGSGVERPVRGHNRRKSSFAPPRRTSTSETGALDPNALSTRQKEIYSERQRRKLETYLQQMIRWLIFRADSTRLCKFLEVSALAIRLSAEGGFQGKQGLLSIASRGNHELRRKSLGARAFADRHRARWFLVRHSYVVCVDGPESLTPYDVFLVDSDFRLDKRKKGASNEQSKSDKAISAGTKNHLIRLYNSERKLKLIARSERQYLQFQESLNNMMANTIWSKKQRFNSFAPVRHNVWARWLVDGRDHMWQVSRAIDNAKDFVYIHDWWLSPELYMRRPAAISQKWRLDRLLQRKAQEGVKIFVIVYRNIESAVPIDSEYTKWSLLDLHENICIQRSPNQFRQNQFFWAHHEKLVVVDNMMAFVGGVDLCFGRWDDPCHLLTDDKLTGFELHTDVPRDSEHCQVWPGKDYSNPRVQDFYALDRPYEEMYDRTKVPRMPWHDIAMQIVGQPARDVGRHFVQRWNYILRSRIPSRPTPVLIPPPEYEKEELDRLGMTGTCQLQILRSCAPWSIGTPNKVEHSIMNAYCHLIRNSEHFVYIENQFYISSCIVEGSQIHNKIGDALVERAIQAYENDEQWQACLIIPLMPGFQNSVDSQDGTSVRLIMQCQYRSICRGETSIFGRLRAKGIDPEEYIRFYSLRQWGKIGPRKCLTTEQLYIHAKCMIVDDRSVIIGSANINERSMLGTRDSEVCAVVTDTRMIPSRMGDKPYDVGEFAHSLRKRLMREHLGIDVDAIYRREQASKERDDQDAEMAKIYRDNFDGQAEDFVTPLQTPAPDLVTEENHEVNRNNDLHVRGPGTDNWKDTAQEPSLDDSEKKVGSKKGFADPARDLDVEGYGFDNMKALAEANGDGFTDSFVDTRGNEVLLKKDAPDEKQIVNVEQQISRDRKNRRESKLEQIVRPPWPTERGDTFVLGLTPRYQLPELPASDDTDIGGPPLTRGLSISSAKVINPLVHSLRRPQIHEDCMTDPLSLGFYHDIWHQVAENNTKLYRQVFRCMPDSEVVDWKTYEKFNDYSERFMQSQGLGNSTPRPARDAPDKSGPPGFGDTSLSRMPSGMSDLAAMETQERTRGMFGGLVDRLRPGSKTSQTEATNAEEMNEKGHERNRPPGSPGSGDSAEHTPLDEKDGARHADGTPNEKTDERTGRTNMASNDESNGVSRQRTVQYSESINNAPETTATQSSQSTSLQYSASQKRRRRGTTKSTAARPNANTEEVLGKDDAEELLKLVQGSLVVWPYDWLEKEERGGNWLYNIDQLAPLEIYD